MKSDLSLPDWRLPPGVSRSLWEFAHDREIACEEDVHLGGAPLLEFDRYIAAHWFSTPGRLVDLGCGTGRSLVDFSRRGFDCVGVDLSQASLEVAAERARDSGQPVRLARANLCELGCLPNDQFDYALLLFGTLGMITGSNFRQQALAHARRVLRPGGLLMLHVHNVWRHFYSPQGRRWLARDVVKRLSGNPTAGDTEHDYRGIPRMYHHPFSRGEITRLLRECGFMIREMIPLAAVGTPAGDSLGEHQGVPQDLACRGWFKNFEATGWLILAEAS